MSETEKTSKGETTWCRGKQWEGVAGDGAGEGEGRASPRLCGWLVDTRPSSRVDRSKVQVLRVRAIVLFVSYTLNVYRPYIFSILIVRVYCTSLFLSVYIYCETEISSEWLLRKKNSKKKWQCLVCVLASTLFFFLSCAFSQFRCFFFRYWPVNNSAYWLWPGIPPDIPEDNGDISITPDRTSSWREEAT